MRPSKFHFLKYSQIFVLNFNFTRTLRTWNLKEILFITIESTMKKEGRNNFILVFHGCLYSKVSFNDYREGERGGERDRVRFSRVIEKVESAVRCNATN